MMYSLLFFSTNLLLLIISASEVDDLKSNQIKTLITDMKLVKEKKSEIEQKIRTHQANMQQKKDELNKEQPEGNTNIDKYVACTEKRANAYWTMDTSIAFTRFPEVWRNVTTEYKTDVPYETMQSCFDEQDKEVSNDSEMYTYDRCMLDAHAYPKEKILDLERIIFDKHEEIQHYNDYL
ncbi:unnamed protein product, partial [Schistosoma turkestanicum]